MSSGFSLTRTRLAELHPVVVRVSALVRAAAEDALP